MNRVLLTFLLAASILASAQSATDKKDPKAAAPAPAASPKAAILANKDSKIYHRADCKAAAKIKASNKTSFGSAAEADKAGFKPCKACKP